MTGGKSSFTTLRDLVRASDYRRFRARRRDNRWAEFLGFSPDGKHVVGFWDGQDVPALFDPTEIAWTQLITYV